MIDTYIKTIASITKRGDAREESYYPALAVLLEGFSETERKKKVHVTVLPKKTEAGNPDFRVWDGKHSQVGYVEAKPPKANLDEIETSEQLKRYIDQAVIASGDMPKRFESTESFVRTTGRRLGEMHVALRTPTDNPDFAP